MSIGIEARLLRLAIPLGLIGFFWLRKYLLLRSARKSLDSLRHPEYRDISPDLIPETDRELFQSAKQQLMTLGFQCLGEFERLDFRKRGGFCICSIWISSDNRTIGEISQVENKGSLAGAKDVKLKGLVFVSPFADGEKLQTSTLSIDLKRPGISVLHLPVGTSVKDQFKAHQHKLEQLIGVSAKSPQRINSYSEYLDYTKMSHIQTAKHLEKQIDSAAGRSPVQL